MAVNFLGAEVRKLVDKRAQLVAIVENELLVNNNENMRATLANYRAQLETAPWIVNDHACARQDQQAWQMQVDLRHAAEAELAKAKDEAEELKKQCTKLHDVIADYKRQYLDLSCRLDYEEEAAEQEQKHIMAELTETKKQLAAEIKQRQDAENMAKYLGDRSNVFAAELAKAKEQTQNIARRELEESQKNELRCADIARRELERRQEVEERCAKAEAELAKAKKEFNDEAARSARITTESVEWTKKVVDELKAAHTKEINELKTRFQQSETERQALNSCWRNAGKYQAELRATVDKEIELRKEAERQYTETEVARVALRSQCNQFIIECNAYKNQRAEQTEQYLVLSARAEAIEANCNKEIKRREEAEARLAEIAAVFGTLTNTSKDAN
jgi:colicin import membrane protein